MINAIRQHKNKLQTKRHTASKPVAINHASSVRNILQAKLKIGAPNDVYEQEADRVGEHVIRMPEPKKEKSTSQGKTNSNRTISDLLTSTSETSIQRQVTDLDEDEELLQAKATPGHTPQVTPNVAANIQNLKGGGQPLPTNQRRSFESRMGQDFSGVRIHTDSKAADTAKSIQAKAFTLGNNIVFNTGQYSHNNQEGKKLLAHELTHVIQQNGGADIELQRAPTHLSQREQSHKEIKQRTQKIWERYQQVQKKLRKMESLSPDKEFSPDSKEYAKLLRERDKLDKELMRLSEIHGEDRLAKDDKEGTRAAPTEVERSLVKEFKADLLSNEQLAKTDKESLQKLLSQTQKRIDELSLADPFSPEYSKLIDYRSKLLDLLYPFVETRRAPVVFDEGTRDDLVKKTLFSINLAFTAYVDACNTDKQKLRDAATAEKGVGALLDLIFAVALGPLALVVSRNIGKLMGQLAAKAQEKIKYKYSSATGKMHLVETPTPFASVLKLSQDETMVREIFKSTSTAAYRLMKGQAGMVYAKTETEQFINALKSAAHKAFFMVGTNLPNKDDMTQDFRLLVTWAAFHPDVASFGAYYEEISNIVSRYQKEVLAIEPMDRSYERSYRRFAPNPGVEPVWVFFTGGQLALALVRVKRRFSPTWATSDYDTYMFIRWVSKRFHKSAIAMLKEKQTGRAKTKYPGPSTISARNLYAHGGIKAEKSDPKGLLEAMAD